MTKAYLAGFIAGMNGKGWDDNPYIYSSTICENNWRKGLEDAQLINSGSLGVGYQKVEE